jgi:hypothetical protein
MTPEDNVPASCESTPHSRIAKGNVSHNWIRCALISWRIAGLPHRHDYAILKMLWRPLGKRIHTNSPLVSRGAARCAPIEVDVALLEQ